MKIRPESVCDFYKTGHRSQYPVGTTLVYSNYTARSSRLADHLPGLINDYVVWFGLQGFIKWFLIDTWNKEFFQQPLDKVLTRYKRRMDTSLGPDLVKIDHIEALHKLGYLPIKIKALPEGSKVPTKVPLFTIVNTNPDFFWLVNYLETVLSAELWKPVTVATIAHQYRVTIDRWADKTGGSKEFVPWQGHDFSMRGMSGIHDASANAGHLLSFLGTDTIPAIDYLEDYYDAENTFVGGSVPATEHSVMSMGGKHGEVETFRRLIKDNPTGVLSIVSDTWDFWNVITNTAKTLKEEILNRKPNALGLAKVVFRPDSGNPVNIVCGDELAEEGTPAYKGAVECLWDIFGGTTNEKGYRTLNQRVGLIYGDSITLGRANAILSRLEEKGFASDNIVFGIGSYTYQFVTRDTYGGAMKATFGEVNGEGRELFKDPITDSGTKKSAKGLLRVEKVGSEFVLLDQQTWEEESQGELEVVFQDGKLIRNTTLTEIRERVSQIKV